MLDAIQLKAAEADLDGDLIAGLAAPAQVAPGHQGMGLLGGLVVQGALARVGGAQGFGHQDVHRQPRKLTRGVAEHALHGRIHQHHPPVRIDHQQPLHTGIPHLPEARLAVGLGGLGPVQVGDVGEGQHRTSVLPQLVAVGVDLHQVVEATLVHVLHPRLSAAHHRPYPLPQPGQVQVAGHAVKKLADVVGQQPEDPAGEGVEAGHPPIPVHHHQAGADGVLDVAQGGIELDVFEGLDPQLVVEGGELLVGSLQFLIGRLQLFTRRLDLLVEGLQLLVGHLQLFDHRLQVGPGVGQFLAQAGDLVHGIDGQQGRARLALDQRRVHRALFEADQHSRLANLVQPDQATQHRTHAQGLLTELDQHTAALQHLGLVLPQAIAQGLQLTAQFGQAQGKHRKISAGHGQGEVAPAGTEEMQGRKRRVHQHPRRAIGLKHQLAAVFDQSVHRVALGRRHHHRPHRPLGEPEPGHPDHPRTGGSPAPVELDGGVDGLEEPRRAAHRLGLAEQQQPPRIDGEVEGADQLRLLGRLEVDQDVAAAHQVHPDEGGMAGEIVGREHAQLAQALDHPPAAAIRPEPAVAPLGVEAGEVRRRIHAGPGKLQGLVVDVRGEDPQLPLIQPVAEGLGKQDGDGIGLFARGAGRHPHPQGIPRTLGRHQGAQAAPQGLEDGPVTEEGRHRDQEAVLQQAQLTRVGLHVGKVILEAGKAHGLAASQGLAPQGAFLVDAQVHPGFTGGQGEQGAKGAVLRLDALFGQAVEAGLGIVEPVGHRLQGVQPLVRQVEHRAARRTDGAGTADLVAAPRRRQHPHHRLPAHVGRRCEQPVEQGHGCFSGAGRQDAQPVSVEDQGLPDRADVDAVGLGEVAIPRMTHLQSALGGKCIHPQGVGQHKGGAAQRIKAPQQLPDTPGPVRKAPQNHQAGPLAGIRDIGAGHPYCRHRVSRIANLRKLIRDGMPKRQGFP